MKGDKAAITRLSPAVLQRFVGTAVIWLIPALLLLPIALIVVGLVALSGEGQLLEISNGIRGKIFAALGPLLLLCGVAVAVFTAMRASSLTDWIEMGWIALLALLCGWFASSHALTLVVREVSRNAPTGNRRR
ncbi:MAG: hypothetical protein MJE77_30125 [Proteobacteria bacterium]|nr:hypothetical protein [Pseudomonadota bacterium]